MSIVWHCLHEMKVYLNGILFLSFNLPFGLVSEGEVEEMETQAFTSPLPGAFRCK